jgi:DNA modification methylase
MADLLASADHRERNAGDEMIDLRLGDCLEVMKTLSDGSVDAVITDPPYCSGGYLEAQKNTKAQGLRGATVAADDFKWFRNDNMGTAGLVWLLRSLMIEARRILKPDRSVFIFTDWRMIPNLAPALESGGMRYRNMIVWDKGNAGLGVGFKPAFECIMEFCNGSTEYQVRNGQNVIRQSRLNGAQKIHNAQKPVELMAEIIRVAVPVGGTVIDPFMGSGTTGVACAELDRNFIGIEISAEYMEIARKRIEAAQQQLTLELV